MFESIDIDSSIPVYTQIENQVRFAICSGTLKPGDRIPAIGDLAKKLHINPNTVAKAYRDLQVMGLVYSRRGTGFFVEKGVDGKCREECYARFIARMHEVVAEAKSAGMALTEIQQVIKECYASDEGPYSAPPAALSRMARRS